MNKKKKSKDFTTSSFNDQKILSCDFETTVYEGQEDTEVYLAGYSELFSENDESCEIFYSISDFFDNIFSLGDVRLYFHNLKFDGSFILPYLFKIMEQDTVSKPKDLKTNTFSYCISDMGQWYSIHIKTDIGLVTIYDSLKLIPLPLARFHKSFGTKHKKGEVDYTWEGKGRPPQEMINYFKCDLWVLREGLEYMLSEGHDKMTIGSCCMSEWRKTVHHSVYSACFPNLYEYFLPNGENAGKWITKAYGGGWCYVNKRYQGKILTNVYNYDVNSLYPYVMLFDRNRLYPTGYPVYKKGVIPYDEKYNYWFIHFKCKFWLKEGYLPFVHIRHNLLYMASENLETSEPQLAGKTARKLYGTDLKPLDGRVEMWMSKVDFARFMEFYHVSELEIIDSCEFTCDPTPFFDKYINKWKKIKENSEGGIRTIAKLYSNNLYGKMAASTNSSHKIAYHKDDGVIGWHTIIEEDKKPGYIPIGAAITSYARDYTIRHALKNYNNFVYSDTDSVKTIGEGVGFEIHPTKYGCWKMEGIADKALFVRQKTYMEQIDGKLEVTCAGMPGRCKELLIANIQRQQYNGPVKKGVSEFMENKLEMEDFKVGLRIPGKLYQKRMKSGVLLYEDDFEIRPK